ncbi:UNVERIFIED_CONTAM: hypothetical protein Sradi_6471700 [Sesamum radiatum]|uniref:Uncharacterized protein n=1 Tax=Sesamum radiatum TaxID=300843 RepID=A0AAW2K546_SESRA
MEFWIWAPRLICQSTSIGASHPGGNPPDYRLIQQARMLVPNPVQDRGKPLTLLLPPLGGQSDQLVKLLRDFPH